MYVSGGHGEKTREYLVVTDGVMTVECNGKEHEIHLKQERVVTTLTSDSR